MGYADALVVLAESDAYAKDFALYYKQPAYYTAAIAKIEFDEATATYNQAAKIADRYTDSHINNELAEALAKADDYLQSVIDEVNAYCLL
jgi:lipid II:glycine glycyltransferase (peptidoglycan interpeptide bridge formation enzyme)